MRYMGSSRGSYGMPGGGWFGRVLAFLDNLLNRTIAAARVVLGALLTLLNRYRIAAAGIAVGFIIAFGVIVYLDFQKVKELTSFRPSVTTKIYDRNDVLIAELFQEKREVVPFESIPDDLKNAVMAIEDTEFYSHSGINVKGIIRAFFVNIAAGGVKQGGSTITQQLSKILLTDRERSLYRKAKEAFIALMMEFTFTKEQIYGMYLNQIFLGHGAYGVEAAAQFYFQKHVNELNTAECALIATLPSAPNRYSPIRHTKLSMQRHRVVLARMVELGFLSIEQAEKSYLDFWPDYLMRINELAPTRNTWTSRVNRAPWFTEYIRRRLVEDFGEDVVYKQGLNVYTTLDIRKQDAAEKVLAAALEKQTAVSSGLSYNDDGYIAERYTETVELLSYLFDIPGLKRRGSREAVKLNAHIRSHVIEELDAVNFLTGVAPVYDLAESFRGTFLDDREQQRVQGCFLSIDQRNGYIEAMVGGSDFTTYNQLNRTMQSRRQPGSSIKPLLYSAAIESGKFTPASAILDSPIVYLDTEGGDWLPENYEGDYQGLVRLRKALALSLNVISIRLADQLGIDTVTQYYTRLLKFNQDEARSRIPRNFSIALGSIEVSPFELTRAYAIIANGGRDVIPLSIRYIKDRDGKIVQNQEADVNKLLEEKRNNGTIQVIKPETSQIMISMMQGVVSSGTGMGASIGRPAAGKTGTTNNFKDAWFVGFTPQLTTSIWIGYDKMGLSLGPGQAGGAVAAPVWASYMKEAMKGVPVTGFPAYAALAEKEICSKTGLLPGPGCLSKISEIFIPGTEPTEECASCNGSDVGVRAARKGPSENLVREQKKSVIKNIQTDTDNAIINDISSDLLGH